MCRTTSLSILFPFLICLHYNNLFAQKEAVLNNPDISWVAEFTVDYTFSLNTPIAEECVKVFKLLHDQESITDANSSNWPVQWIVEQALEKQYECYKDSDLIQKLSSDEWTALTISSDTTISYDPTGFEIRTLIVSNYLEASMVKYLRLKQLLFYNKQTDKFGTLITTVAPLLSNDNDQLNPLFWIKMDQMLHSDFDLQSPDISWAALAYTQKKATLSLKLLKVLKNEQNIDFKDFIYQQAKSLKHPLNFKYSGKPILDEKTFSKIYNRIDTIATFDPETYEETINVIKKELHPREIDQFRLVQKWYYDRKKKQLMSALTAISPIVDIRDDNGKIEYSKPIYYIRYD